jgi:GNAT superfamily N-acetyltransferase
MSTAELVEVTLRVATLDDAGTLAALMAEMDDDAHESLSAVDSAAMRESLASMAAYPNFRTYILVDDEGNAIATFSLMVFAGPAHQGATQAMLDAVVVTRAWRGKGVGKILIGNALDIAGKAGSYKMSLSSNLKRVDAHRFYEGNGFHQHGISFAISLNSTVGLI